MLDKAIHWNQCIKTIREGVQQHPGQSEVHQQSLQFVDQSLAAIVRLALHAPLVHFREVDKFSKKAY